MYASIMVQSKLLSLFSHELVLLHGVTLLSCESQVRLLVQHAGLVLGDLGLIVFHIILVDLG